MNLSISRSESFLFRTPFAEGFDLVQKFIGLTDNLCDWNNPVNFDEAGLIYNEKWDEWHIDIPFSIMNDEPTPCIINGRWLGANHEFPRMISVYVKNHGRTSRDIGARFLDAEGTEWTLIATAKDRLSFLSENLGESIDEYSFKEKIAFPLNYVSGGISTADVEHSSECWFGKMPILRHTTLEVIAYKNGEAKTAVRSMECDRAEIHESYDICNPESMRQAIMAERPEGGYAEQIGRGMGDSMVHVDLVYNIEADGSVIVDFRYKKTSGVHLTRVMGAMFQEKLDPYGGGVYRYIPKTKLFTVPEGDFDFASCQSLAPGPFPHARSIDESFWTDRNNPPDRIIDYMRDREGNDRIGFACGYFPVYDGIPENRAKYLKTAVDVRLTRKAYPFFMDGHELTEVHGIAYKKYFERKANAPSYYTVCCEGVKYGFVDFFSEDDLTVEKNGRINIIDISDTVSAVEGSDSITFSSSGRGYAVFVEEE